MRDDKSGQRVPRATFRNRYDGDWHDISSDDLFTGKTVVVFSLPGAFTPTCSSAHVPRYNDLAPRFKQNGVDDIVCISVNDGFVMEAWQKDQDAQNLTFVADGNGAFTEQMGMLVDKQDLGFGRRSWRYSMLVTDGTIKKMFIEPDTAGDPFEVSDADTMLRYINPASITADVAVFTKAGCSFCIKAKKLLAEHNIPYQEIVVGRDVSFASLGAISGQTTVPQLFVDGKRVGNSEEITNYLVRGEAA